MPQRYGDVFGRTSEWISSRLTTLIEVIHSPESAFSRSLAGPSYLMPLVVLGFLSIVVSLFQLPFNLHWAENQMLASGAPADQVATNLQWMQRSTQFGLYLVPLLLLVRWILFAALLWLTVQLISEFIEFQKVLTVVAYSYVAILFRDVFIYIIVRLRSDEVLKRADGLNVAIGLNLIFPSIPLPWSVLAGNVNIFELWYVILLSMGISRRIASTWRRGMLIVLPNWLFATLVQVGIVSLGLIFQSNLRQ